MSLGVYPSSQALDFPDNRRMKETIYIPIVRYTMADGRPTCATDFSKGEICIHLRLESFGTRELCGLDDKLLERDRGGEGVLIPTATCPLFHAEARLRAVVAKVC